MPNWSFTNMTISVNEINADKLKEQLAKYGTDVKEYKDVKEDGGFVKYSSDYVVWNTDKEPETGYANQIVLTKCSYRSTSPFIISYIDRRNSLLDVQEISSDF